MDRAAAVLLLLAGMLAAAGVMAGLAPKPAPDAQALAERVAFELAHTWGYRELYVGVPCSAELEGHDVVVHLAGKVGRAEVPGLRICKRSRAGGPVLTLFGDELSVWLGLPSPPPQASGQAAWPKAKIVAVLYPPAVKLGEAFTVKVTVMNVGGMGGAIFCRLAGRTERAWLSPLGTRTFEFTLTASSPGSHTYTAEAGWSEVDDARTFTVVVLSLHFERASWPQVSLSADKRSASASAPASGGQPGGWTKIDEPQNRGITYVKVRVRGYRYASKSPSGGYLHAYGSGYVGYWASAYSYYLEVGLTKAYEAEKVRVRLKAGRSLVWWYRSYRGKASVGVIYNGRFYGSSPTWVTSSPKTLTYTLPGWLKGKPVKPAVKLYSFGRGCWRTWEGYIDYFEVYREPKPAKVNVPSLLYVVNPSGSALAIKIRYLSGSGLKDMELKLDGRLQVKVLNGRVVKSTGPAVVVPAGGRALISLSGTEDGSKGYSYGFAVEAWLGPTKVDEIRFKVSG